jgi:hypothetical protein
MKAKALAGSLSAFGIVLRDNGADRAATVVDELVAALERNSNTNVPELSESNRSEDMSGGASATDAIPVVKSLAKFLGPIAKKDLNSGLRELVDVLERLGSTPLCVLGPAKEVVSASRSRSRRGAGPVDRTLIDSYIRRLETALGDDAAFTALYLELDQDSQVGKAEAVAIADCFMGPVAASTTRPKALQRILFRHRKLMGFTTGSESIGGKAA